MYNQNTETGFPREILGEDPKRYRYFVVIEPADSITGGYEFKEFDDPEDEEIQDRAEYGQTTLTAHWDDKEQAWHLEADCWYCGEGVCRMVVNFFTLETALRVFNDAVQAFGKAESDGTDEGEITPGRFIKARH